MSAGFTTGYLGVQVGHVPAGTTVQTHMDQGARRFILWRAILTDGYCEFTSGLLAMAGDARLVVQVFAQQGTARLAAGSLPAIICWVTRSDNP